MMGSIEPPPPAPAVRLAVTPIQNDLISATDAAKLSPTAKDSTINTVSDEKENSEANEIKDSPLISSRRRVHSARRPRLVITPRAYTGVDKAKPTFYIGATNGAAIVEEVLLDLGWRRIMDKNDCSFKMRWVECKAAVNYSNFRDGDQLVNRIPNCALLTNKMGLLTSLQAYDRVLNGVRGKELKMKLHDFVPETYRLDCAKERKAFLETYKEGEVWICKPTGMNQGKGIYLIRSLEEIERQLKDREKEGQRRKAHRPMMGRIIQRYITHPLLLDGRKFDVRAYMLVASTVPFLILFHQGYVRLTMYKYDIDTTDLTAHLTNQYIQKKDPAYQESKESTAWSMEKFNDYVNQHCMEEKGLQRDWVWNHLTVRMKEIMLYCFNAVRHKLHCQVGYFDLYGLDFMVDNNMQVSLIEVNVNPALAINCEALKEVIPGVIKQTIHIALECFEKARKKKPLLPLQTENTFQLLHCGCRRSRNSNRSDTPGGAVVSGANRTRTANTAAAAHRATNNTPAIQQQQLQQQQQQHQATSSNVPVLPHRSSTNSATIGQQNTSINAGPVQKASRAASSTAISETGKQREQQAILGSVARHRAATAHASSATVATATTSITLATTTAPPTTTDTATAATTATLNALYQAKPVLNLTRSPSDTRRGISSARLYAFTQHRSTSSLGNAAQQPRAVYKSSVIQSRVIKDHTHSKSLVLPSDITELNHSVTSLSSPSSHREQVGSHSGTLPVHTHTPAPSLSPRPATGKPHFQRLSSTDLIRKNGAERQPHGDVGRSSVTGDQVKRETANINNEERNNRSDEKAKEISLKEKSEDECRGN